jgi:hypothetical protein
MGSSYRNQLRPVLEMLKSKRKSMGHSAWKRLVLKTEQTILSAPQEYVVARGDENVNEQIKRVFAEFMNELRDFSSRPTSGISD